jgi:hypothetical protein
MNTNTVNPKAPTTDESRRRIEPPERTTLRWPFQDHAGGRRRGPGPVLRRGQSTPRPGDSSTAGETSIPNTLAGRLSRQVKKAR